MKVMLVAMVAVVGLIASSGFADGTIKDTCGIAPDAFKTWRETSLARRGGWYAKAEKTVPKLYSREVKPVGLVKGRHVLGGVFPGDQLASPYKTPLINSYCHAWSCAPAYFLRNAKFR